MRRALNGSNVCYLASVVGYLRFSIRMARMIFAGRALGWVSGAIECWHLSENKLGLHFVVLPATNNVCDH